MILVLSPKTPIHYIGSTIHATPSFMVPTALNITFQKPHTKHYHIYFVEQFLKVNIDIALLN